MRLWFRSTADFGRSSIMVIFIENGTTRHIKNTLNIIILYIIYHHITQFTIIIFKLQLYDSLCFLIYFFF